MPPDARRLAVGLLAIAVAGCGDAGQDLREGRDTAVEASPDAGAGPAAAMAPIPEATSLAGEPLYALDPGPEAAARLDAQIDSAEAAQEADPDDPDLLIWLGRRYAYAGRYRDAIDVFTEGIDRFPDDARFYRHRGHRYITVRELDRAIADLEHAARLISGTEDVVEPDGQPNDAGIPRSTLHTNIWYHLGLARYLQGDFEGAVYAYRQGLDLAPNDDMAVAMADWLWMALMRLGREAEAQRVIAFVQPEMDILENDAYHRRLLLYRGLLRPAELAPALADAGRTASTGPASTASQTGPRPRAAPGTASAAPGDTGDTNEAGSTPGDGGEVAERRAAGDRDLQLATYGYGLGNWYLVRGDRVRARETFRDVLRTGYWPAFGYIAAEAELARWDEPPSAAPEASSRTLREPGQPPTGGTGGPAS